MKLGVVVVTYGPNPVALEKLCSTLALDGSVFVVDNSMPPMAFDPRHCAAVVRNGRNLGIAEAQNIGIRLAKEDACDACAFFDQDSQVPDTLVPRLLAALPDPERRHVVAPFAVDSRTGRGYPGIRLGALGWPRKVWPAPKSSVALEVDVVISSGTVATFAALAAAGPMATELFIDGVDTEWCLRARRAGVTIQLVPDAILPHTIGERVARTPLLNIQSHAPARSYFQLRNAILMFRYKHVPKLFAWRELLVLVVHLSIELAMERERLPRLGALARGLRDGLFGRSGPMPI